MKRVFRNLTAVLGWAFAVTAAADSPTNTPDRGYFRSYDLADSSDQDGKINVDKTVAGFLSGASLADTSARVVLSEPRLLSMTSKIANLAPSPVPEPGAWSLAGVGMLSLLGMTIVRQRAKRRGALRG
jgi:hypothetical protein